MSETTIQDILHNLLPREYPFQVEVTPELVTSQVF